jgi:predicted ATPase
MAEEPREWEREWLTIPQSHSGSEICTQDVIPVAETVTLKILRTVNRPLDGFFLRAESFYNFATLIEEYGTVGYGGKSLHHQSHGESFLSVMTHRFGGRGIYLLDEPEAALSPQHQLSMLVRLHDLVADSSQFIIATHSPLLMAYPEAWIYQFTRGGIQRVAYEDTEHYRITHSFMRNPQRMMRELLQREGELDLGD